MTSATVALLTSISMAFAIVAIVLTIDMWRYVKTHHFNRYEMEMAYLQGFEDAVFNRRCDRKRAFDATKGRDA